MKVPGCKGSKPWRSKFKLSEKGNIEKKRKKKEKQKLIFFMNQLWKCKTKVVSSNLDKGEVYNIMW